MVGDEREREVRFGVLLLRVLEVAGVTDVRVVLDRGEPLVEGRPRLPDQFLRRLELQPVGRADRVGAGADRAAGGREGSLPGPVLRVEPRLDGAGQPERSTSARDVGRGPTTTCTRSLSPSLSRPLEPLPRVPVLALDHVRAANAAARSPGRLARAPADRSWTDA